MWHWPGGARLGVELPPFACVSVPHESSRSTMAVVTRQDGLDGAQYPGRQVLHGCRVQFSCELYTRVMNSSMSTEVSNDGLASSGIVKHFMQGFFFSFHLPLSNSESPEKRMKGGLIDGGARYLPLPSFSMLMRPRKTAINYEGAIRDSRL